MKLVIDIPEKRYKDILYSKTASNCSVLYALDGIRSGTPHPKGHGRLGDLDALEQEMINGIKAGNYEDGYDNYAHINNMDDCVDCVRYADTIIEADKAESEDKG